MTQINPDSAVSTPHSREGNELWVRALDKKLLPPIELKPFTDDHELTETAFNAMVSAAEAAIQVKKRSNRHDIPDDAVTLAVLANFKSRFDGAEKSLQAFFAELGVGTEFRRIYSLHSHSLPDLALLFFLEQSRLPSLDLAAALCTDDSRNITSEVLKESRSHFPNSEEVFDDSPVIEFVDTAAAEYVVFSVEKCVMKHTGKDVAIRRRKTYIASAHWLAEAGSDLEGLKNLFVGGHDTPDEVYPVIESIYAVR